MNDFASHKRKQSIVQKIITLQVKKMYITQQVTLTLQMLQTS
jgi:hypothetical protein